MKVRKASEQSLPPSTAWNVAEDCLGGICPLLVSRWSLSLSHLVCVCTSSGWLYSFHSSAPLLQLFLYVHCKSKPLIVFALGEGGARGLLNNEKSITPTPRP